MVHNLKPARMIEFQSLNLNEQKSSKNLAKSSPKNPEAASINFPFRIRVHNCRIRTCASRDQVQQWRTEQKWLRRGEQRAWRAWRIWREELSGAPRTSACRREREQWQRRPGRPRERAAVARATPVKGGGGNLCLRTRWLPGPVRHLRRGAAVNSTVDAFLW